jgi:hypothetical protein
VRSAAIVVVVAAVVLVGCRHHALMYMSDHPSGPSCLSSRGCPAAKPLPPCAPDVQAAPLDEILARDELVGKEVIVTGPLGRGDGVCTLLGCYGPTPGGACCNKCSEALLLGSNEALADRDYQRRRKTTLMLSGPGLACGGDESLTCCPVDAHGQMVSARGVLRREGITRVLESARLCAAPGS